MSTTATAGGSKKVPASIDALLAAQKREKEEQAKPRFLTKAQREQLAQEKEKEQQKERQAKEQETQKRRDELERAARLERQQQQQGGSSYYSRDGRGSSSYRDYDRDRDRDRDRDAYYRGGDRGYDRDRDRAGPSAPRGPRADYRDSRDDDRLYRDRDGRNASASSYSGYDGRNQSENGQLPYDGRQQGSNGHRNGRADEANAVDESAIPVFDPAALKARYLGDATAKKRKVRKQNDKKFVFDWDKDEDTATTDEIDPFYRALREGGHHNLSAGGAVRANGNGTVAAYRQGDIRPLSKQAKREAGDRTGEGGDNDEPLAGPTIVKKSKVKSIIDDRHWSEKPLSEMRDRDWRIFREDFSIAARGGQIPLPIRNWQEAPIPAEIKGIIDEIGYAEPSAIQRQSIPIGLNVRDMIGIAETGSGKTAAFVIPMLAYIMRLPPLTDTNRHMGPYALILAPTRELAQQIEVETRKFTSRLGYKCVSIVGGRSMEEQALNLRDGCEIIIATPGRLKDCIERSIIVFSQCTYVVMDEADRMISLGFEDVINTILDSLPVSNLKPDTEEAEDASKMLQTLIGGTDGAPLSDLYMYRQTMMFSATMPAACERLARKYLRRPAVVTIGVAGQAVDTVEQRIEFISGDDKRKARLLEILNKEGFQPPIIVFVNTKKAADMLSRDLNRTGWSTTTLHSGKTQEQREAALASLRSGEVDLLVATDLAGRGIDVPDVSLVVNFQMSSQIEAYIHRIGRTGRAGKTGVAVTFLGKGGEDDDVLYDLRMEVSKSPISKVPPELAKHEAAQSKMSSVMKRKAYEAEDQG